MKAVVFGSSNKSWAFAMEQIALKKPGERLLLIDSSSFEGVFRSKASKKRRRFQNDLLSGDSTLNLESPRSNAANTNYIFRLLLLYFQGLIKREFPVISHSNYDLSEILFCRLAARLGTRFFKMRDVKLLMFIKYGLQTLNAARHAIKLHEKYKIDSIQELLLFNGRLPIEATFYRIWNSKNLRVRFAERGSSSDKYQVFDISPHFHPNWWSLIHEFNESVPCVDEFKSRADKFRSDKLKGLDTYKDEAWNIDYQQKSPSLKEGFILYLSSSSTEYSPNSVHNFISGYEYQTKAVEDLLSVAKDHGIKLVIRRHPNSVGYDWMDREDYLWSKFKSDENVVYFGPESRVSSYSLALGASRVYVWKSSMGFETLAMGKTTFCLASAKWSWLDMFQLKDKKEIEKSIFREHDKESVEKVLQQYAHFMANSGTTYTLFKKVEKDYVFDCNGVRIAKSKLTRVTIFINFLRIEVLRLKPKRNA